MAFLEAEFIRTLGFNRVGGQGFNTSIVPMQSGQEQRNQNWSGTRARYTCSLITPVASDAARQQFVDDLRNFYIAARGKANGFRFYDHLDNQATDEPVLDNGDGT